MSSSWSTEQELRALSSELYSMIDALDKAADILRDMRETENIRERARSLKQRAKDWMK